MSTSDHFRVLDAIGNSLHGRIYTVGDTSHTEHVLGVTWLGLQEMTGLRGDDLESSVDVLLDRGLIRQGGPVRLPVRRLQGRRHPLYLWATPEGRRVLAAAAGEVG